MFVVTAVKPASFKTLPIYPTVIVDVVCVVPVLDVLSALPPGASPCLYLHSFLHPYR